MKRTTLSIILGITLFSLNGIARTQTFNTSAFSAIDSLKNHPNRTRPFQWGLQIEHVVRTGYSSQMNYEYKPVLIQFEFQKLISKKAGKSLELDYFIQPQFNTVKFRELGLNKESEMVKSFETGVNAGLILQKPLIHVAGSRNVNLYALGSLGPHYIGASPSRQAKGFLFSDNFRVGMRVPVTSFMILDMRTGIRHLSNASLKAPNGGLDDIMFGAGIRFVKE